MRAIPSKKNQTAVQMPIVILLFVSATALVANKPLFVYVFRNFQTAVPERMLLVGEIQSKTKEPIPGNEVQQSEYDTRPDRVTVKILDRRGLKKRQKLYVIDKDPYHERFREGTIVGEIEVVSIFYSPFYGWALSGRGLLLRVRKGHFVARTLETESQELAFAIKRQGDHYARQAKPQKALASYRNALSADTSLPEAHAALGDIYFENSGLRDGSQKASFGLPLPVEVLAAYEQAWKYRQNFHYQQARLKFYHNYMEALYLYYRARSRRSSREQGIVKYLDRSLEVGTEALRIRGKLELQTGTGLARAHYYRMLYYSTQSNPRERRHYDHSKRKADFWLKKLLAMDHKSGELIRVAILFYGYRYKELSPRIVADIRLRGQIRQLLLDRLGPYYSLYLDQKKERRDPQVDRLLQSLR